MEYKAAEVPKGEKTDDVMRSGLLQVHSKLEMDGVRLGKA
jgi:hypothetical protein